MKVVVIDDEKQIREGLKILLAQHKNVIIVGEAASVNEGVELIDSTKPDLIFLDIQLKKGTGFNILENVTYIDFKLVFVTAYNEYAIKAFKYSAFDYLLKPIDPVELNETLKRLTAAPNISKAQISNFKDNKKQETLIVKTTEQIYVLPLSDIIRCEANLGYTFFYLKNDTRILSSKTLKEYDAFLADNSFIRIHQSHLVNINYIKSYIIEGKILLKNSVQLPVSIRKRKEVKILISQT